MPPLSVRRGDLNRLAQGISPLHKVGDVSVDTLDAISRALVAANSDLAHLAAELGTHMNNERMVRMMIDNE